MASIRELDCLHDTPLALAARLLRKDGTPIVAEDCEAVTLTVVDEATGEPVDGFDGAELVVADVVLDALATPPTWTADRVGYNVQVDLPASALPAAGTYRVDLVVRTTADADPPAGLERVIAWRLHAAGRVAG